MLCFLVSEWECGDDLSGRTLTLGIFYSPTEPSVPFFTSSRINFVSLLIFPDINAVICEIEYVRMLKRNVQDYFSMSQ
ncbi:hypothetical protein GBA52_000147 [Prunus armeniaca]|nr:hypothetical protein GBA52_000147 [Prunus armeniaca]